MNDVEVSALDDRRRREFRVRQIGMVFQEFELLDHLSVLDNVLLPYRITPALTLDADVRARALDLAERVGLGDKIRRPPRRLSQGERQRVGVCRALLPDPPLLFADEPTGNLDPATAGRVLDLLLDYAAETGTHAPDGHARPHPARPLRARPRRRPVGEAAVKDVLYLAWRYLAHHRVKTGRPRGVDHADPLRAGRTPNDRRRAARSSSRRARRRRRCSWG